MTPPAGRYRGGVTRPTTSSPGSVYDKAYLAVTISTLTLVALAAFDGMAVAATLPKIGAELGVRGLPGVITAFSLTSTIALLASGPIIDTLGVRTTYRITLVVFFASSLLCAAAPNLELLIAARVVQGSAGGVVMAVTLANVGLSYPAELRPRAIAANSLVWGVMALAGPGIAAFVLTIVSWRGVFALNIPLVLIAGAIGWNRLPSRERTEHASFDWTGLAILSAFITVLLLALSTLRWASLAGIAVAIVLGAAYWRHSGRAEQPVLARRHFATWPFGLINLVPFTFFAGSLALDAFLPIYVQGGLGKSTSLAAFAVAFIALGWTTGSNIASRLLDRASPADALVWGFGITLPALAAGIFVYTTSIPIGVVYGLSFAQGLGIGMMTNAAVTLIQSAADPAEMGRASSAHQFSRHLGGTIGTAAAGAVLFGVVSAKIGSVEPVRDLLDDRPTELGDATRAAIATGFRGVALVSTVITAGGLAVALKVRSRMRTSPPARTPVNAATGEAGA
jgi:MFS family permease